MHNPFSHLKSRIPLIYKGTSEKRDYYCNSHTSAAKRSSLLAVSPPDTSSSRVRAFRSKCANFLTKSRFSEVPKHIITHEIKFALLILATALLFASIVLSYLYKGLYTDLNTRNLQINTLIDEVGVLQEENMILSQEMDTKDREFSFVLDRFGKYSDRIEDLDDAEKDLTQLRRALDDANISLDENTGKLELFENSQNALLYNLGFQSFPEEILDILILGTHDSLTDTIILASINPALETISLMSIPRDLYVKGRKINEIYTRYGIDKLIDDVYEVSGIRADRYVVVDFIAFREVVDILGGIDIFVKSDLVDLEYPDIKNGYSSFSIRAGDHHLDGTTALKYVRSRKSTSDFDRAARQQQVLEALLKSIQKAGLLENIEEGIRVLSLLHKKVKTNLNIFEIMEGLSIYNTYTVEANNVLSTSNYLYSATNQQGQYILLPYHGNYSAIHAFLAKLVKE